MYEEQNVIASVQAYFQVAYKVILLTLCAQGVCWFYTQQRIIDYVPLTIEHELNQAIMPSLQILLFSHLKDETAEKMRQLLSEDPTIARKRTELEGRIARLTSIKEKLDFFTHDWLSTVWFSY